MRQFKGRGVGYEINKPHIREKIEGSDATNDKKAATENIFDALMNQMDPDRKGYVRQFVNNNDSELQNHPKDTHFSAFKTNRQDSMYQHPAEQDTLEQTQSFDQCSEIIQNKHNFKHTPTTFFSIQNTPKYSSQNFAKGQLNINGFQPHPDMNLLAHSQIKTHYQQDKETNCDFIIQLDHYLNILKNKYVEDSQSRQKSLTIKSNQDYSKLALSHEKSLLKIKDLKLKNYLLEKDRARRRQFEEEASHKEQKMRNIIHKMMNQIQYLNSALNEEKKGKRKLEKIISSLQANLKQCKPNRNPTQKSQKRLGGQIGLKLYRDETENQDLLQQFQEIYEFTDAYVWKSRPKVIKNPFQKQIDKKHSQSNYYQQSMNETEQMND